MSGHEPRSGIVAERLSAVALLEPRIDVAAAVARPAPRPQHRRPGALRAPASRGPERDLHVLGHLRFGEQGVILRRHRVNPQVLDGRRDSAPLWPLLTISDL